MEGGAASFALVPQRAGCTEVAGTTSEHATHDRSTLVGTKRETAHSFLSHRLNYPYPARTSMALKINKSPASNKTTAAPNPMAIRCQDGQTFLLHDSPHLKQLAMYWSYAVRNRVRWSQDESARDAITRRAVDDLSKIGLGAAALDVIANAGIVEVQIPFAKEELGWETRILPWEFVLALATASRREGQSLLVVRHLDREKSHNQPNSLKNDPSSLLAASFHIP
jgi:hypothetical protein